MATTTTTTTTPVTETPNPLTTHLDAASPAGIVDLLAAVDAELFAGWGGAAGLAANLAAARAGKRILLANKEALVMTGPLFMAAVRQADQRRSPMTPRPAIDETLRPT